MDKRKDSSSSRERVINLSEYRRNKNEQRRRDHERILFNRILGVYSFIEKAKLHHMEVVDMSYSGLKFREQHPEQALVLEQKIPLRFYFTPSTFLRIVVEIKRAIPFIIEGKNGMEYGCEIDNSTKSYEVLHRLIDFMHSYSDIATEDHKPPMLFF